MSGELPGTGGALKTVPEDFIVEELPAYAPSGAGGHVFLWIEKRGLNTDEAVMRLCAALGARREAAGTAGWKDRQAVARQWVSLEGVDPARAQSLELDGVRVLEAHRHGHKLRTGHLHGNRFTITIRGTTDGVARARAMLGEVARAGLTNFFGEQRLGRGGLNVDRGRRLLTGSLRGRIGRAERRLYASAYQAELFNRYLARRRDDGLLTTVLAGDVVKRSDSGGLFIAEGAIVDEVQTRHAAGAVELTGPIFGHKMMAPPAGSPAGAREQAVLAEEGIDLDCFGRLGAIATGTRRLLMARLSDTSVAPGDEPDAVVLRFTLPAGAYATVLLALVMKNGV